MSRESVRKPTATKGAAAAAIASDAGPASQEAPLVSADGASIATILARETHQRELRRLKQQRYRARKKGEQ